jgi:rubrerythrin
MQDELSELLQTVIYKEIASQAFYSAAQSKTNDHGAKALLKELAEEELRHSQVLMELSNQNRDLG